jgi:hypothetical protein
VLFPDLLQKFKRGDAISKSTINSLSRGIRDDIVREIMSDLVFQSINAAMYGLSYLTDREIDFDLIEAANRMKRRPEATTVLDGFEHALPFVHHVPLKQLVELRMTDGEAFQVYRDSLSRALREYHLNGKSARETFDEVVRPEIHKMDLALKRSRRATWNSARSTAIITTALITVGLVSGLINPSVAAVVAGVGGLHGATSLLKKANSLLLDPQAVERNPFYFLWQAKKLSR